MKKPAPKTRAKTATMGKAEKGVFDSFQNLAARMGVGNKGTSGDNISTGGDYTLNPITRQRATLEFMYRGAWIAGIAVDAVADDMVREGADFSKSLPPEENDQMVAAFETLRIWQEIGNVARWARLYGGAIGVMMIDGQDMETPLRLDAIQKGQFKGLAVLDRWSLTVDPTRTVQELGPDIGKIEFYTVGLNAPLLSGKKIHYSRVLRMDGIELPYQQRIAEQGWGMSVIERMYDRMVAFDSATTASAQLIYKAHYRTYAVEGLEKIIAAGGAAMEKLAMRIAALAYFQSVEGVSLINEKDRIETHTYAFSGLDGMLLQFAQQISGNLQIPMVRLFGQSPAGLNSTGESDWRNYYDGIKAQQEARLRVPVARIIDAIYRSTFGKAIPSGFKFSFKPLWQLREQEKSAIAAQVTASVISAHEQNIIGRATSLAELRASAPITGMWSTITDEMIEDAKDDPPPPAGATPEELVAQAKVEAAGGAKGGKPAVGEEPAAKEIEEKP